MKPAILISALHKRVHDALFAAQLDPKLRAFHPHITLARVKEVAAPMLRPFLKAHENQTFSPIGVEHFSLFSSRLEHEGSLYTVDCRYGLKTK